MVPTRSSSDCLALALQYATFFMVETGVEGGLPRSTGQAVVSQAWPLYGQFRPCGRPPPSQLRAPLAVMRCSLKKRYQFKKSRCNPLVSVFSPCIGYTKLNIVGSSMIFEVIQLRCRHK